MIACLVFFTKFSIMMSYKGSVSAQLTFQYCIMTQSRAGESLYQRSRGPILNLQKQNHTQYGWIISDLQGPLPCTSMDLQLHNNDYSITGCGIAQGKAEEQAVVSHSSSIVPCHTVPYCRFVLWSVPYGNAVPYATLQARNSTVPCGSIA